MQRVLARLALVVVLSLSVGAEVASADPVNSPRVDQATLVCGDVTYTTVSPFGAPVNQMVTANGSNSTRVGLFIVDKAGSRFPQNPLTHCTFTSPENFDVDLLITPVH